MFARSLGIWGLLVTSLCAAIHASGQEIKPAVSELFRKEIAPGQNIVVTREPFDAKRLGALDTNLSKQDASTACIRVESHVGNATPVFLGSAIQADYPDFRVGFRVLDVIPGNNELVLACAMRDLVGLWRIRFDLHWLRPDGWTWISLTPSRSAVAWPIKPDEVVTVAMTPLPDGRWTLTITDKSREPGPKRYQQVDEQWKFKPVTD